MTLSVLKPRMAQMLVMGGFFWGKSGLFVLFGVCHGDLTLNLVAQGFDSNYTENL